MEKSNAKYLKDFIVAVLKEYQSKKNKGSGKTSQSTQKNKQK